MDSRINEIQNSIRNELIKFVSSESPFVKVNQIRNGFVPSGEYIRCSKKDGKSNKSLGLTVKVDELGKRRYAALFQDNLKSSALNTVPIDMDSFEEYYLKAESIAEPQDLVGSYGYYSKDLSENLKKLFKLIISDLKPENVDIDVELGNGVYSFYIFNLNKKESYVLSYNFNLEELYLIADKEQSDVYNFSIIVPKVLLNHILDFISARLEMKFSEFLYSDKLFLKSSVNADKYVFSRKTSNEILNKIENIILLERTDEVQGYVASLKYINANDNTLLFSIPINEGSFKSYYMKILKIINKQKNI